MNVKYDCKKSIALGGSFGCVLKARGTALMSDSSLHFACALREFYVNGDNFMIIRFMKLGNEVSRPLRFVHDVCGISSSLSSAASAEFNLFPHLRDIMAFRYLWRILGGKSRSLRDSRF